MKLSDLRDLLNSGKLDEQMGQIVCIVITNECADNGNDEVAYEIDGIGIRDGKWAELTGHDVDEHPVMPFHDDHGRVRGFPEQFTKIA